MIRLTYSSGETIEYAGTVAAAMDATQAIIASQGLIVPIDAVEVLEQGVEIQLKVKLGLVELTREV